MALWDRSGGAFQHRCDAFPRGLLDHYQVGSEVYRVAAVVGMARALSGAPAPPGRLLQSGSPSGQLVTGPTASGANGHNPTLMYLVGQAGKVS